MKDIKAFKVESRETQTKANATQMPLKDTCFDLPPYAKRFSANQRTATPSTPANKITKELHFEYY